MGRKEPNQTNKQNKAIPVNKYHVCSTTCEKEDRKLIFKTNYRLIQVKSIAECSKWSILQYFQPSLS